MTLDINYFESGYIESGYFNYTADAESSQNVTCSVSAIIGVIKDVQATMSSTFNQTSVLSNLKGADLFAFTNAALAAEVTRIRENNTQVSSAFDLSTFGLRIRYVSAQCDSDAAISSTYDRIRNDEAAFSAAFSSLIEIESYTRFEVALTSNFNLELTLGNTQQFDSSISSNFELTAINERIIQETATLDSTSELSLIPNKIIEFNIVCESLFSPSIECTPIRNSFAVLDSTSVLSIIFEKIVSTTVSLEFNAELSVIGTKTIDFNSNQTVTTEITAVNDRIRSFDSAFNSNTNLDTIIDHIVTFESLLNLSTSISISTDKYVSLAADLNSPSELTAIPNKIIQFSIICESLFSPSITVNPLRNSFAVLDSTSSLTAEIIKTSDNFSYQYSIVELSVSSIHYVGMDVTLNSEFTQSAIPNKIIQFSIICESLFSPAIVCNPLRNHFAHLETNAVLSASLSITRNLISNQQSTFTQISKSTRNLNPTIGLNSTATLVPYGSFKNKRPYSAYPVGSGLSFVNYSNNLGGYSLSLPNYASASYLRIEHNNILSINATQNFYFRIRVSLPTFESINESTYDNWLPVFRCGSLRVGFYRPTTTSSLFLAVNWNSSMQGVYQLQTGIGPTNWANYQNQFFKYEIYRYSNDIYLKMTYPDGYTTTVSTVGNTSSLDTISIPLGAISTLENTSSSSLYVDELFLTRGVYQVYDYKPNGEINDGWRSTTHFLYNFNNNFVDDMSYTGIQNVTATLSSISTILANAGKSVVIQANLNSNATLVCNARFMPLEFDATLNSSFIQISNTNKVIDFNASQTSNILIIIDNLRTRDVVSHFDAIAIELAAIGRIGDFFINCETNATLIANPVITTDSIVSLNTTASIVNQIDRYRTNTIDLTTSIDVSATLTKVINFNADLNSEFTQVVNSNKVKSFDSILNSTTELYASNYQLASAKADLSLISTLTAIVNPIREFNSYLASNFTISLTEKRIRDITSTQEVTTSISNQLIRYRKVNSSMQAFVSQMTAIAKKVNEFCAINVSTSLYIEPTVIIGNVKANLGSAFTQTCVISKIRKTNCNLQITTNLTSNVNTIVRSSANIASTFTVIAVGSRFYFDAFLTYVIPYEERLHTIELEIRDFIIEYEDRTNIIGK